MRLRAALAAVVAVLVLAMPCAGSGCALRCAMQPQGCEEAGSSADSGQRVMAGMSDCGMGRAATGVELKAPACLHAMDGEQPAALVELRQDAAEGVVLDKAAIATGLKAPVAGWLGSVVAATPPLRTLLVVSLQSCLRV